MELKLSPEKTKYSGERLNIGEKEFRWMVCADAMTSEKLFEGIRGFSADIEKLENIIRSKL